jgi:hypothetical protein
MKFIKTPSKSGLKFIYFFKTPLGWGEGLPEGPKDFRSLALDTIREVQNTSFPDQKSKGYLFLQAADRFIKALPEFHDEEDAVPLAFFVNAQLSLVRENVVEFLEHIDQEVSTNPKLINVKEFRDTMGDSISAQQKYYDGIFTFWHSHEILYKALEKVQRRRDL